MPEFPSTTTVKSDLFDDDYLEFFQALAHFAYPGDAKRFREARSGWRTRNPCEYPPLFDEHGWDVPETGRAFIAFWLKFEDGAVRSWRRMGDGSYKSISRPEWRRQRLAGDPRLGVAVGQRIFERAAFLVLLNNEHFLMDVVVSRDDMLKLVPAAPAAITPVEATPGAPATPETVTPKPLAVRKRKRPVSAKKPTTPTQRKVRKALLRLYPEGRGTLPKHEDTLNELAAEKHPEKVNVGRSTLVRVLPQMPDKWLKKR